MITYWVEAYNIQTEVWEIIKTHLKSLRDEKLVFFERNMEDTYTAISYGELR